MRVNYKFLCASLVAASFLMHGLSTVQAEQIVEHGVSGSIVFSGHFSREENDGKMARLSGKSHYMKFYSPDRVIRLFIPYPYSASVKSEVISKVFDEVSKMTVGNAFIRGKFGQLEQDAIANIGKVKNSGDDIMFDCNASAPCRIIFLEKTLKVIKKGIISDHVIVFDHVDM